MNRIEQVILKNLIYNEEYSKNVLPYIKEEYFSDVIEKKIFIEIFDFVNNYKTIPTNEALVINITNKDNISEKEISGMLDLLNEISNSKNDPVKKDWLIEQTEIFCQDKAIYNAIMESVKILNDKQTRGKIPKLLSDALGISFQNTIGHDYIDDVESRYEKYHEVGIKLETDLSILNKITGDGFGNKTLNVIIAGTNVGKSLTMCHLASCFLSKGKNVLYVTMEMSESNIGQRIDANLLNVDIGKLKTMSREDYLNKFKHLTNRTNGKLIIKEYPTASASALHFMALLSELEIKRGFIPDVIFVDYLNICSSSRIKQGNGTSGFTYYNSVAQELRGLAMEYDLPVITATQLNRAGLDNSDIDLTNISESIGIAFIADLVLGITTNEELDKSGQLLVKQLKNRYADMNYYKKFLIGVEKSKMRLFDVKDDDKCFIVDSGKTDKKEPINKIGNRDKKFNNVIDFKF